MTTAEKLLKIDEGVEETIALNAELEQTLYGTDTGGKSFYDEYWDMIQNYGNKQSYSRTFQESAFEYIRPKYKVVPKTQTGVAATFEACTKLKKVEADYFDFSQVPFGNQSAGGLYYTFVDCVELEEIEDIGLSPTYAFTNTFQRCYKLHTIAKITFNEDVIIRNPFDRTESLENITIGGTIGQNGFDIHWSTKLSKASITSIVNALSTTTSGLTVTLSKIAANNAFETSAGAADGSTSAEWLALIGTRSNWTISLV